MGLTTWNSPELFLVGQNPVQGDGLGTFVPSLGGGTGTDDLGVKLYSASDTGQPQALSSIPGLGPPLSLEVLRDPQQDPGTALQAGITRGKCARPLLEALCQGHLS